MNDCEKKTALRHWILERNTTIRAQELADDTPILKERILTSLQIMDLVLFLEELGKRTIKSESLRPGAFDTVDAIYENFLRNGAP